MYVCIFSLQIEICFKVEVAEQAVSDVGNTVNQNEPMDTSNQNCHQIDDIGN